MQQKWNQNFDGELMPDIPQKFLNAGCDVYMVMQLRHDEKILDERFASMRELNRRGKTPDPEHYEVTYYADLPAMWQDVPNNEVLEELFQMFNLSRPQDFEGHSLSVSDVIALKRNGEVSVHYVDSIGFKDLQGFLDKQPERPSVLLNLKEKCDAPECNPIVCRKVRDARNIEAIRTLFKLEQEHRGATAEEQQVLSQYVGWGGLADAFDPNKDGWAKEYTELKGLLSEDEYAAARSSTLNAHYTSPTVIRGIYDAVERMGFRSGNILEPSMGVGNFFGMLPDTMQDSRLYGVELDSITGRIAQKLYPEANIKVAGFETTDRRDFYDLAVGNVPFGNYKVNDKAYNKLNFSIHNYFFAKAIDQVRPGGVVAFVTSRYTLDSKDSSARKHMAERGDLLGAIRLPNNAFRANAGTDVVSDIIFLQKRDRPIDHEPDWVQLGKTEDGFAINQYFVDHPEMVLGQLTLESTQYGHDLTVAPIEGAVLADQLAEAVQHIEGNYTAVEIAAPDVADAEAQRKTLPADPTVKNFSYTVVDGEIYYRENSIMTQIELSDNAKGRVAGMVELRQIVNELIDQQLNDFPDEDIKASQAKLNAAYDAFTAKYGLINDKKNARLFDDDSSYYLLCSLENLDENKNLKSKADMFTKRTIRPERVVTSVDTPSEALAVSIGEHGKVDLPYMAELLGTPGNYERITTELSGVIFKDPAADADDPEAGWQTADEYLSGNVRDKLRMAQLAAESHPEFKVNVDALTKAQPKDLEASEIDVRLGATWLAPSIVQQFMMETFQPPYRIRYNNAITVRYSPYTSEWRISNKSATGFGDIMATETYGTRRANAYKILEDTLNLRDSRIYDTIVEDGKEKRVLNQNETTLAQQKQQAIKDAFAGWVWKDPQRRTLLVKRYNELFNSTRPREYDGSHIHFVGIQKLKPIIRSAAAYAPPEVVDGKPPVYPYTPIKSDFEDAETVEEMMLYTELQSAVHAMIQRLEYSFTFNPSLLTSPKRKKQVAEILTEAEKYIWRI